MKVSTEFLAVVVISEGFFFLLIRKYSFTNVFGIGIVN